MSAPRPYRPPREAAIGSCPIACPSCGTDLGFALRVTIESARQSAKRSALPEAFVVCSSCHRQWVAGLWLSIAAGAGSERVA